MAVNPKLEAFLAANEPENLPAAAAPEPQEAPKPEAQPTEPTQTKEPAATPEPQQEPDDEVEAGDMRGMVPRASLVDERNKRRDWKGKADKYEGENAELRRQAEALQKQLAELQKPAPQQPQPQQQQQSAQQFQFTPWEVDPVRRAQEEAVNQKFEQSEQFARYKHGDEVVDRLINDFAELTAQNPALRMQLFQQRDPFGWAHKEVERQRLLQDMGNDPTAYRERLLAEERAKWEAEFAARTNATMNLPKNTPPPAMPPSLAGVRSAAPRGAPQWSGPLSDQQIVANNREFRMAQRRG